MSKNLKNIEIDHHTTRFIVGIIALSLASLTSFLSEVQITSISASYYEGEWPRNIFVGFLFAISAFLLSYNGKTVLEMMLSKVAAVAAMGVAMFPCKCDVHDEIIPHVHGISALVMFLILTFFCHSFFQRAIGKGHAKAKLRAGIYAGSCVVIVTSITLIGIDSVFDGSISLIVKRLVFYCEAAALIAFGVSWLTASLMLPVITNADERLTLYPVGE